MSSQLAEVIARQRDGCAQGGSPLYAAVLDRVAADVVAGGPCLDALQAHIDAPLGDAVLLRLLAAVHEIVLDGRAPDLGAHYPSVGGRLGAGVGDAFVATVAAHLEEVVVGVERPCQTNEVGRSAVLLGGLLEIASRRLPVRLLEVGASAGLNLNVDRYRVTDGDWSWGPHDSPVRFVDPWEGTARPPLGAALVVAERRGCDLRPLDPGRPADLRRLRALVWPDHVERRRRLDAALSVAEAHPVVVEQADAAEWIAERLSTPAPGVTTVVLHSVVAQYMPKASREALVAAVGDAGVAATDEAPLAWLRMEPGGGPFAELRLTEWPGRDGSTPGDDRIVAGRRRVLAHARFHGPPITWAPQEA